MSNKTLADILAEMRRDDRPYGISPDRLRSYADRIEAAATRECEVVAKNALKITCEICERQTPPGNAAALRAALEDTEELLEHFAKPGTMLHSAFFLHMRDNRAALAAPPRNCDRFKAADEARMAFWDTHETIWDAFKNRGGTELFYEVLDWLFAPAEGKEASNG